MILLNGHSLERKDWFRVETMALNLEERNSTATITVGPEAPEIAINDWLQDDTEPGKGIVWRVRTVTKNVETRTRTIQLEHIVQLLKDRVLFDEIKPDTITGNSSAEKCTAWEAADYIMRRQTEWRLGQIEGGRSAPYNFNGDTLFTALETVTNSLPDLQWEYDLRSMPFTLNIMRHPTGFQSEMRMRRNISTMRIQIDRTRMYTRLYPIGKNNLHISGNYVSKNERVWGRVDKVLTDQTRESEEDLLGWAQDNLNRHCEPLVTVTITGLELSASTGEPLDHIVVGRRCRVPIPKYGIWMTERVTKMSWGDKIKEPQKVTVTLANQLEDVASIINQQNTSTASSSASGRRGAKKNEEDHAWFVDTTDHVAMVAEAVAGEGAATDWSRVSEVLVDGQGIHQRVTYAEGEIVKQEARIDINERRILQEVNDRTDADSTLSGRITTEAGRITAEVTRAKGEEELLAGRLTITERQITQEVTDRTNAYSTLSGRITTNANKVAIVVEEKNGQNVVKAASIVTAINDSESSIRLDADKVYIGNQKSTTVINGKLNASDVTADYLDAKISQIAIMHVRSIQAASGAANANLSLPSVSAWNRLYIGSGADTLDLISGGVKDAVTNLQLTLSGNTYTLKKKTIASHADWTDVGTFSRATTLQVEYGGDNTGDTATYKVTASPQGNETTGTFKIKENKNAAWIEDPNGVIRARIDNPEWNNGGKTAAIASVVATGDGTPSMVLDFGTKYLITPKYTNAAGNAVNTGNTYLIQSPAATVTLTSDSIGDVSTDSEGNVYAKLNGTTKVTKQITLTKGTLNDGSLALNAYCDGTRVARKWVSFSHAKLYSDHYDSSTKRYYFYSTTNITSSNRVVAW